MCKVVFTGTTGQRAALSPILRPRDLGVGTPSLQPCMGEVSLLSGPVWVMLAVRMGILFFMLSPVC